MKDLPPLFCIALSIACFIVSSNDSVMCEDLSVKRLYISLYVVFFPMPYLDIQKNILNSFITLFNAVVFFQCKLIHLIGSSIVSYLSF